jgi:hypothetical protein
MRVDEKEKLLCGKESGREARSAGFIQHSVAISQNNAD